MTSGLVHDLDLTGAGPEIIIRVFRIDPALNGVHGRIIVLSGDGFARGDLDLFFDQIEIGHLFRHTMFNLDARVHLHEIEIAVLVYQELNCTHTLIADGRGCLYRSRKEERIPYGAFSLLELAAVLFSGGCFFIAARQVGALGAVAFRYNVLFTPSAVLLVWLLAVGKGVISRLLSAKPFLWLAGLSPYGFLIHQVLIRYMELAANKLGLTAHPVVWTLTVFLLTLCLSSFYKALEHRVRKRHIKTAAQ